MPIRLLILSAVTLLWPIFLHASDIVGPIVVWQDDPCTTASILWIEPHGAEHPAAAAVEVKPEGGVGMPVATAANRLEKSKHAVHRAKLSGLKPGTVHTVEVRQGGKNAVAIRFRTASDIFSPNLRFVTGGDMYHKREWLDAMNARAGAEDPVFALLGGDLAYANNSNPQRWLEWVESWAKHARAPDGRAIPMVVGIGNHEVTGIGYRPKDAPPPAMAGEFYSLFQPPHKRANSTLDFGSYLSLILLDSGHTATINSQTDWLEKELAKRKDMPRLMVCYHRPAWGSGVKDDAIDIQRAWCPLFEKHRADVVFENDHHCFKRTYPLRAGSRDDTHGVPYLGDGAWGVEVRGPEAKELAKRPWITKAAGTRHLWRVTLGTENIRYEALGADGKVFDSLDRPLRRNK